MKTENVAGVKLLEVLKNNQIQLFRIKRLLASTTKIVPS
jgi:hypothetical protein